VEIPAFKCSEVPTSFHYKVVVWRNISSTIMFVPRKFYYVEKVPLGTILI
jgi:hypothetical protein